MYRATLSSVLIIACAAISLASPDVRFASGKSALNIPFKLHKNHIYLQVSVNNAKPLWFLLDTGAGNAINLRHARSFGLKLTPAGQTTGTGEGVADIFTTDNISYSLPGIAVGDQRFAVLSLENVEECVQKLQIDADGRVAWLARAAGEKLDQPMDGVLGAEFFELFVVEIDYVTKTINLHNPQNYRYQGDGEKIPLEIGSNRHIFMRAQITSSLSGRFLIDTGSAAALILNSPFVKQNKLLPPADQTTPFATCGIGGDSQTQVGKISEIRLGNVKVENPVTLFSQARNGALADPDISGNIGNAILRRFRIVFDYSRKVMILERV